MSSAAGGADVTHKHQMEAAVEVAARSVAEEHLNVDLAGGEPETQLALMLRCVVSGWNKALRFW